MRIPILLTCVLGGLASETVFAGETPHPVKMSRADIAGQLFENPATVEQENDGITSWDREVYLANDKDLDMGLWRTEAFRQEYTDPWPYNEYIHITDGSLTVISSDGTVTELATGDSAMIPMGWTGTWDTPGLTKIYVIYAPNKDL